jgi:hypothetical protein
LSWYWFTELLLGKVTYENEGAAVWIPAVTPPKLNSCKCDDTLVGVISLDILIKCGSCDGLRLRFLAHVLAAASAALCMKKLWVDGLDKPTKACFR